MEHRCLLQITVVWDRVDLRGVHLCIRIADERPLLTHVLNIERELVQIVVEVEHLLAVLHESLQ
jgi:hypothetical protein